MQRLCRRKRSLKASASIRRKQGREIYSFNWAALKYLASMTCIFALTSLDLSPAVSSYSILPFHRVLLPRGHLRSPSAVICSFTIFISHGGPLSLFFPSFSC
ncbi:hypothetical protein L6452_11957 [Arctium lappa]|uniref:Uncharacterized protein n=1 Tax=Arctium lappa TaxID=4217 RepID=A0ACB9DQ55_ARCLA|nr:hypothetical protein L6452_11957 [Arctium lappa]